MNTQPSRNINIQHGTASAIFSAALLGFTPIIGKLAISYGFSPFQVVTLRTFLAAIFIAVSILAANRTWFYIYPAGLIGCTIAGIFNGIGSLFYYHSLSLIHANIGQLIYMTYPMFVVMWIWLDGQKPTNISLIRLTMILTALCLLIFGSGRDLNMKGFLYMLTAGALYAIHLPINQRVLYEMPAPTVTFYTLLAMSIVVIPFMILIPENVSPSNIYLSYNPTKGWLAIISLAIVTFISRVALFFGVKKIGGIQTALLGVIELVTALLFSGLILGEALSKVQWIGVALIILSIWMIAFEKNDRQKLNPHGWLHWIVPSSKPSKVKPTPLD